MDKLAITLIIAVGLIIGVALPTSKGAGSDPRRITTPSEPPRETDIEGNDAGMFFTYANVNGQLVKFVVDTGASEVVLTPADAERAGIGFDPGSFRIVAQGAGGPVRGQEIMIGSVELDGKLVNDVPAMVNEGASHSLLGQTYLSHLGSVQLRGTTMVLR